MIVQTEDTFYIIIPIIEVNYNLFSIKFLWESLKERFLKRKKYKLLSNKNKNNKK
jgi:hypothetical protein